MKMTLENMSPQSFGEAHKTGREEGLKQGEEIGRVKGREEGLGEVAANLVRLGYKTDDICRMTNLDREAVEAIRKTSGH